MSGSQLIKLNISLTNANKTHCDGKCDYNFNYPEVTFLQIKNNTNNITVTEDHEENTSVTFDGKPYHVSKVLIYSPSLHSYEGSPAVAEVMIEHITGSGDKPFSVFIPMTVSSNSSKASNILSEIVKGTASKAPGYDDQCTLTLREFTFGDLLPKGPFFNYTGTYGSTTTEFIVYGKSSSIAISSEDLSTLNDIITPSNVSVLGTEGQLYVNSKGANLNNIESDGIYIKCKPTGKSTDMTEVENTAKIVWGSTTNYWGLSPSTFATIVSVIVLAVIILILLYVVNVVFNMISPTKPTSTSVPPTNTPGFFENFMSKFS